MAKKSLRVGGGHFTSFGGVHMAATLHTFGRPACDPTPDPQRLFGRFLADLLPARKNRQNVGTSFRRKTKKKKRKKKKDKTRVKPTVSHVSCLGGFLRAGRRSAQKPSVFGRFLATFASHWTKTVQKWPIFGPFLALPPTLNEKGCQKPRKNTPFFEERRPQTLRESAAI